MYIKELLLEQYKLKYKNLKIGIQTVAFRSS